MSDMDLVQGHSMVEEISDIMSVHLNVCLKARDCHLEKAPNYQYRKKLLCWKHVGCT